MGKWSGVIAGLLLTVGSGGVHAASLAQMQYAIQHQQCPERRAPNTSPEQVCPASRDLAAQMPECRAEYVRRQRIINAYNKIFDGCAGKASKTRLSNPKVTIKGPPSISETKFTQLVGESSNAALRSKMNWCNDQQLDWAEISSADQILWAELGWSQQRWDSDNPKLAPASDEKDWMDLSATERKAASELGFDAENWEHDCKSPSQSVSQPSDAE